jgi:hypothetical protein
MECLHLIPVGEGFLSLLPCPDSFWDPPNLLLKEAEMWSLPLTLISCYLVGCFDVDLVSCLDVGILVIPYGLVGRYQCFSEMLMSACKSTWHYNPEDIIIIFAAMRTQKSHIVSCY